MARELARRLADGPTAGIGLTKRLLNAAEDSTLGDALRVEAELQELAGRTDDHAEGVAAFGEKRDPRFTGR
jgi:2-(1,2-epoxy-1,2-dihydrophenyl)acetyl-CoA isomerase